MSAGAPLVMPGPVVDDVVHYLATGEDPHRSIADDVEAQFNLPHASFTVSSRAEVERLRAGVSDRPWVTRVERVEPTPSGFVLVMDYDTTRQGQVDTVRTVTLVTVEGRRITAWQHWCTGAL
jgi:hypothetical protein